MTQLHLCVLLPHTGGHSHLQCYFPCSPLVILCSCAPSHIVHGGLCSDLFANGQAVWVPAAAQWAPPLPHYSGVGRGSCTACDMSGMFLWVLSGTQRRQSRMSKSRRRCILPVERPKEFQKTSGCLHSNSRFQSSKGAMADDTLSNTQAI